jgi:quinol monooxygenase YgiN
MEAHSTGVPARSRRRRVRPHDCPARQSGFTMIREDARPGTDRVDPTQPRKSLEARAVSELLGIARFKFHEGKLEEFKRLSAQAMEIVRTKDTGTLQYDTYFNDDQSECMVIERYRDAEAAIEHAANLADLSAAILATVSVVHGELLGEPSAELRAKLAGSEVPVLFTPYQSM